MNKLFFILLSLVCSFETIAQNISIPVNIGGSDNLDACSSLGYVSGFKSKKGFLAVRSGSDTTYQIIDKLRKGQRVFICQISPDTNWYGIVYSYKYGDDCGVASPVINAQPYSGKCKSGWVYARWIKLVAG